MQSAKKNLLLINNFDRIKSSIAQRHINLIKHFNKAGYKITLISNNHDFNSEYVDCFIHISISKVERFIGRVYNKLVKQHDFSDNKRLQIHKYKKAIKHLLSKNYYDAIIVLALPFSLYKLGISTKKHALTKTILDQSDPLFCNIDTANLRPNASLIKRRICYESKYLKHFDAVVLINKRTKQKYIEVFPDLSDRFHIIDQGFNPRRQSNRTTKLEYNSRLSFVYIGRFYKTIREPNELYKALERFKNAKLHLYGYIPKEFLPCSLKYSRIDYQYHGPINPTKVDDIYDHNDVIVFIDNFKGVQTPGKLLEVINTAKPVLYIYEQQASINDYDIRPDNVFMAKNDENEIYNAIKIIMQKSGGSTITDDKLNAYSWQNLVKKYIQLIEA